MSSSAVAAVAAVAAGHTVTWNLQTASPCLVHRSSVCDPLATGLILVDASIPIGRGQRQLILGDRKVGKTTMSLDCVMAQRHEKVLNMRARRLVLEPMDVK